MRCMRCGSHNVNIQVVNEVELKNKHYGCLYWALVGWWWVPFKWLYLTGIALFAKIFIPHRQKAVNKTKKIAVCQNCGNVWDVYF